MSEQYKVLIKDCGEGGAPMLYNEKTGQAISVYRLADVTGGEVYYNDPLVCSYWYDYYHELNGEKELIYSDARPEGNGKDYSHYLNVDDSRWDTYVADYKKRKEEWRNGFCKKATKEKEERLKIVKKGFNKVFAARDVKPVRLIEE